MSRFGQQSPVQLFTTQRSNECACSSLARAVLARVGMGCTISIETSKRQNGGRFKFRGICFQLAGIRRKQTAKVFTLNTALKGTSLSYIFFNKKTISATIVNFLVEFTRS